MGGDGAFVAALMLGLVLAGLCLRLPAPLVLAGAGMLGALLGQWVGIYDFVLLGDLASSIEAILDNETLIAIPLLVLSGTLLGGSQAFASLRLRLQGPFGAICDLLLAMAGGGGRHEARTGRLNAAFLELLERATPASAFLVLLSDLIDTAVRTGEGPFGESGFAAPLLMAQMILPALLLGLIFAVSGMAFKDEDQDEGSYDPLPALWLSLSAALAALAVPALILFQVASLVEAAALGVGAALLLKLAGKDLRRSDLGTLLDHALTRSAIPFATLMAGALFHLVFQGIGGGEVLAPLFALQGSDLLVTAVLSIALLGILIEPLALAVLLVPLLGPLLLDNGHSPALVGALFVLAPFPGALFPRKAVLAFAQACALSLVILVPMSFEMFQSAPLSEPSFEPARQEEGFTPEDTADSPQGSANETEHYAPPSENE